MKKALHNRKQRFLLSSKGQLIGWGTDDVKNLVKNANRAKEENLKSKPLPITIREAECLLALEWFELFFEKGITEEVIKKINSRIAHVRYHHVLMHSPKGLPYWRRIANGDQIDDPEISVAYGVAHLLAAGALKQLRRCKMQTCQNFFTSNRPDAKWCLKSCGSLYRVRQKRKREKR